MDFCCPIEGSVGVAAFVFPNNDFLLCKSVLRQSCLVFGVVNESHRVIQFMSVKVILSSSYSVWCHGRGRIIINGDCVLQMSRLDPAVVVPVSGTCILVFSVALEMLYVILCNPSNTQIPLLLLSSYLLFNVVGNMVKFVRSNSTIRGVFLQRDNVGQGWL